MDDPRMAAVTGGEPAAAGGHAPGGAQEAVNSVARTVRGAAAPTCRPRWPPRSRRIRTTTETHRSQALRGRRHSPGVRFARRMAQCVVGATAAPAGARAARPVDELDRQVRDSVAMAPVVTGDTRPADPGFFTRRPCSRAWRQMPAFDGRRSARSPRSRSRATRRRRWYRNRSGFGRASGPTPRAGVRAGLEAGSVFVNGS